MNFLNTVKIVIMKHSIFRKLSRKILNVQVIDKVFLHRLNISDAILLNIQRKKSPKQKFTHTFEGKSVENKSWFNLNFDWVGNNFTTRGL